MGGDGGMESKSGGMGEGAAHVGEQVTIVPFPPTGPFAISTVSSSANWASAAACCRLLAPPRATAALGARQCGAVAARVAAIAIFARTHNVA